MASLGFLSFIRNQVLGSIIGFGAGTAASQAFEPAMRPLGQDLESKLTNQVLSPADLAACVVQTILADDAAADEATKSGFNRARFEAMVKLSGDSLGPQQLIQLLQRGVIDEPTYEHGMRTGRVRNEWITPFLEFAKALLSPPDLAEMAVQGIISEEQGAELAKKSGVDHEQFHKMYLLAGNPPGGGELLQMWNRGIIGETEVDKGLKQSRLKPEWVDEFKKLRDYVPTPVDVERFAVREVYDPATVSLYGQDTDFPEQALEDARRTGLSEEVFRKFWAAHWNLPSTGEGYAMLHRGIIDQAGLERLLRVNDVMPYWREKLIELAHIVPGRIDLRRMFAHGVITRDETYQGYIKLGYTPQDAERLTTFAEQDKLTAEKELTKAEIVNLYKDRAIPRDQAVTMLDALGYNATDADLILGIADYQKDRAYRQAVVSVVRARYLDREIDTAEATAWLDKIGIPPDERENDLDLWTFARDENPTRLTEPQIRAAFKAAITNEAGYRAYLTRLGYPQYEQDTLVKLYAPTGG